MPTIITHGVVAAALTTAFPRQAVPRRLMVVGIACSMVPDVDVFHLHFGAHQLLDHRGITHSLVFATALASLAFVVLLSVAPLSGKRLWAWIYLVLATASHGLLDAMTDKNGLGIPFFWPFDSTRYFFSFAPIAMSPVGTDFFSSRSFAVLLSEFQWVWIPSLLLAATAFVCRRVFAKDGRG